MILTWRSHVPKIINMEWAGFENIWNGLDSLNPELLLSFPWKTSFPWALHPSLPYRACLASEVLSHKICSSIMAHSLVWRCLTRLGRRLHFLMYVQINKPNWKIGWGFNVPISVPPSSQQWKFWVSNLSTTKRSKPKLIGKPWILCFFIKVQISSMFKLLIWILFVDIISRDLI
jgi:hypothetical protein